MSELKILIVDDEELIRDGIARKIQKMFPHALIVGKAEDAATALEIVRTDRPGIVITDIRMPEIDGFEFIEQLKKEKHDVKFILVSGFEDFEYARKAIRLGVGDYLLKPVDNEELRSVVEKMELQIAEENHEKSKINELKSKSRNTYAFLLNKYLTDLINHTDEFDVQSVLKPLETIDVTFPNTYFSVVTIIPGNLNKLPLFPEKEDMTVALFAAMNITEEVLKASGYTVVFENLKKENHIVAIINHENIQPGDLVKQCRKLLGYLNEYLGMNVSIGIGKYCTAAAGIGNSYTESYSAALQKFVLGDNNVIYADDIPDSNSITFFMSENDKQLLLSCLTSNAADKAKEAVDRVFAKAKSEKLSYANLKTLYIDIAIMIAKIIRENGGSMNHISKEDIFSEDYVARFTTSEELGSWLKECITSTCAYLSDLRKSDGRHAIEEIKEYINNYYYTEINLNDLSKKYYINASYLSLLFKNESGERFVDYITRVRMEKAKELLSNTDLKTYKIAEMVGYADARYFSDVFSKCAGTTPTKYREMLAANVLN